MFNYIISFFAGMFFFPALQFVIAPIILAGVYCYRAVKQCFRESRPLELNEVPVAILNIFKIYFSILRKIVLGRLRGGDYHVDKKGSPTYTNWFEE